MQPFSCQSHSNSLRDAHPIFPLATRSRMASRLLADSHAAAGPCGVSISTDLWLKFLRKSPIKAKLLRNPGQSLDEQIEAMRSEQFADIVLPAFFLAAIAAMEWLGWYLSLPRVPLVYTLMALIALWVAIRRFRTFKARVLQAEKHFAGIRFESGCLAGHRFPGWHIDPHDRKSTESGSSSQKHCRVFWTRANQIGCSEDYRSEQSAVSFCTGLTETG